MYTPSITTEESNEDDFEYSGIIPQLPVDIGSAVLEPEMRKLRHVMGIALRNVSFDNKGKKNAIRNVDKIRRSSIGSLDESGGTGTGTGTGNGIGNGNGNERQKRSRRLTRDASQLMYNPVVQQALQDLNWERLLDTMYALYVPGRTSPVYISESMEGSINPEFSEMNIESGCCSGSGNETIFMICVWGRIDSAFDIDGGSSKWKKLFTEIITLSSLVFIGKSIDTISIAFPMNSLIVFLTDGCYILPKVSNLTDRNDKRDKNENDRKRKLKSSIILSTSSIGVNSANESPLPTLSFDSIMKINNLEECICDSEQTIKTIKKSISLKLHPSSSTTTTDSSTSLFIHSKHKSELSQKIARIRTQTIRENTRYKSILQEIEEEKKKIALRKEKLVKEREVQQKAIEVLSTKAQTLLERKQLIQTTIELISIELSRMSTCLQEIFPIERDDSNKSEFSFTICGLELPDASDASITSNLYNEDEIAAAYGLITQLVHTLSCYMGVSLRYPVQTYGSKSFVIDPISTIQGMRTFPLWTKGSIFYRFEYGVYLFHKDIEQLANFVTLPIVNLRHTLANIKNLLLVLSSPGNGRIKVII